MRCDKHRKDHVGGCMWCGRQLCEFCIVKRENSKLYCEKCVSLLGSIRRERLPQVRDLPPTGGRRFVLKDGYLEVNGGR